ncbi:MAG: Gfo/Idh/MocA family oxidoreductase [Verrucomicrobia bacterium]|nr:Gfo/Idh/MocA family oxidoreductase [Verrucomicrobiota bacterium]
MSSPSRLVLSHDITRHLDRRQFLIAAGAATAAAAFVGAPESRGADTGPKVDLGLIGCGGRGRWIADLFLKHGGYHLAGVYDYFADRANAAGDQFQVPAGQRYSGLYGYRKMLEQKGLDAVAIESPPFFHPMQAADAVAAGKHVYLAKPVAVDVPGCQSIADSGQAATGKKLVFLVDFQTRAHPAYQEVVGRVHRGELGRLVSLDAGYQCDTYFQTMDAEYRKSAKDAEARVRAWAIDRVLSGDVITEQNIHALDVATWFLNANPIKAHGSGGHARGFAGDCWDHYAVVFYFPDDVLVSFSAKQVGFGYDDIMCRAYGLLGTAETHYAGKVTLRTKDDAFNGDSRNLYQDGAVRNIATFHQSIAKGDFSNPTVAPSVRSNLTTILGRMAAYRRGKEEVTWTEMMNRAEKWEFPLGQLKA